MKNPNDKKQKQRTQLEPIFLRKENPHSKKWQASSDVARIIFQGWIQRNWHTILQSCLIPWTMGRGLAIWKAIPFLPRWCCPWTLSFLASEGKQRLGFFRAWNLGCGLRFRVSWIQACLRAWSGVMRREGSHLHTNKAQHGLLFYF